MTEKILFIDDEENVLHAFKRQLRNKYEIDTAISARDAIYRIGNEEFAVIISDLRMPFLDGIEFFSQAKRTSPDSVRILLTGQGDLNNAVKAINEGDIFRFLTKPCPIDILVNSIEAALKQYRLITIERELIEKTLSKTVQLMTDMLGLSNPVAYGRAIRVKQIVRAMAANLEEPNTWQYELAAMLSHIGCVALPEVLLEKVCRGKPLENHEENLYASHPLIGYRLLKEIPRLESIAEMIRDQQRDFASFAKQPYSYKTSELELGAQMLRVASDYDRLIQNGLPHGEAIRQMLQKTALYDTQIVESLGSEPFLKESWEASLVDIKSLQPGMIIHEDIYTRGENLLVTKGMVVSSMLIERIKLVSKSEGVVEPFRVLIQSNINKLHWASSETVQNASHPSW